MTGTGTSTDAYIVSTWEEFTDAINLGSRSFIKFADNTVIDMNEVAPQGITDSYDMSYIVVDGNGAIIKNLYLKKNLFFYSNWNTSSEGDRDVRMKNIHFLNVYSPNNSLFCNVSSVIQYTTSYYHFQDMTISGIFGNYIFYTNKASTSAYSFNLQRISLNVNLLSNGAIVDKCRMEDSCIYFESPYNYTSTNPKHIIGLNADNSDQCCFSNTLIRGKCGAYSYFRVGCANNTYSKYNIIDIESGEQCSIKSANSYTLALNLVNQDNFKGTIHTAFTKVTSDQLRDASYLRSIGFPIGVD